jgi:hypothetical protein
MADIIPSHHRNGSPGFAGRLAKDLEGDPVLGIAWLQPMAVVAAPAGSEAAPLREVIHPYRGEVSAGGIRFTPVAQGGRSRHRAPAFAARGLP